MAHAGNTPSDRSPSDGTPDHRPGQRARMAVVWGIFAAVVVIALVVWLVIYTIAR